MICCLWNAFPKTVIVSLPLFEADRNVFVWNLREGPSGGDMITRQQHKCKIFVCKSYMSRAYELITSKKAPLLLELFSIIVCALSTLNLTRCDAIRSGGAHFFNSSVKFARRVLTLPNQRWGSQPDVESEKTKHQPLVVSTQSSQLLISVQKLEDSYTVYKPPTVCGMENTVAGLFMSVGRCCECGRSIYNVSLAWLIRSPFRKHTF